MNTVCYITQQNQSNKKSTVWITLTWSSISQTENHGFIPRNLRVFYAFCVCVFSKKKKKEKNDILNKIKTHSE